MIHSPQKNYFTISSRYKKIYNIVFWASLLFTIIFTFLKMNDWINYVSVFSITLLLVLDYIIGYYVFKAEELRRMDYFDKSFGTRYSHEPSENYYDTEEIDNGLYKMIANTFECSLFSMEISKRMKNNTIVKNLTLFVIIICFAIYGFSRVNCSIPILQLFLSKDFIKELIEIHVYNNRVEKIFNDLKKLFDKGLVNTEESIKENIVQIIKLYMEYETNISDLKVSLDTKIYNSMNEKLTVKWEEMKERYGIK